MQRNWLQTNHDDTTPAEWDDADIEAILREAGEWDFDLAEAQAVARIRAIPAEQYYSPHWA